MLTILADQLCSIVLKAIRTREESVGVRQKSTLIGNGEFQA